MSRSELRIEAPEPAVVIQPLRAVVMALVFGGAAGIWLLAGFGLAAVASL